MFGTFVPKHTKQYANISTEISRAISCYKKEVEANQFPTDEHSTHLKDSVLDFKKHENHKIPLRSFVCFAEL